MNFSESCEDQSIIENELKTINLEFQKKYDDLL